MLVQVVLTLSFRVPDARNPLLHFPAHRASSRQGLSHPRQDVLCMRDDTTSISDVQQ